MILLNDVTLVRSGKIVLEQTSLQIAAGEAVAVIGQTACGKTSLIAAMAGVLKPASGLVKRMRTGADSADRAPLRIGYAPGDPTEWPVMRADEFLEMVAVSAGLAGKPLRLAVQRGLAFAECTDICDHRLERLSDGQRKRLLLAGTLVHDPDVLLLDDPMRSLDAPGRTTLQEVIADLTLAGGTVVAALNDAVIGSCWSRVLLLGDGAILDTQASDPLVSDAWPDWSVPPLQAWRRALHEA
jgi:ABC-2 type transport system ATP-binding protein